MPGRRVAAPIEPTYDTLLLWWIGDQQVCAGKPEAYFAAERKAALSRLKKFSQKTLQSAKWLAEEITPEQRHPALSWNHHVITKTLAKEERRFWLEEAAKKNLSTRQLREQIKKRLQSKLVVAE